MSASSVIAKLLTLTSLAKAVSADAGNPLTTGTDGLLWVGPPAGLKLIKTEFFTSTSLQSNNAGWTKAANAKWIVVIAVGGGGSGGCYVGGTSPVGYSGGEPGSVEIWRGWAADLPATADVVVGAGGATPTTTSGSNDGGKSSFANVLSANGGMGGANVAHKQFNYGGAAFFHPPQCSFRLGIPGGDNSSPSEDTIFGPGPGGPAGVGSGRGGSSNTGRPISMVAGGAAAASNQSAPGAGGNAIPNDPWSFGSGGASAGNNTNAAGSGGVPGGGGGGGYSGNGGSLNCPPGAGGRGEVRVLTYG